MSPTATLRHGRPDLVHPAGVLVTDRVGQRHAHRLGPLALDDVQVGAAHARRRRSSPRRRTGPSPSAPGPPRRRAPRGTRAVVPLSCVLHRPGSPCPRCVSDSVRASMPRQMPLFASTPTRVSLAFRRCSGTASRRSPPRWWRRRRAATSSSAGSPSSARRARSRSRSGDGGASPERHAWPAPPASGAGGQQRPAHPVGAGQHGLADEVGAQPVELGRRLPAERRPRSPARAATPPLIASEAKWSSSTTSARVTPVDPADRVVGVGDHEEGEVRRAEVRRQPQAHRRPRPSAETVHEATNPSAVTGSSSSGSRTVVQRGEDVARPRSHSRPRRSRRAAASSWAAGVPPSSASRHSAGHLDVVQLRGVQPEDLLLASPCRAAGSPRTPRSG